MKVFLVKREVTGWLQDSSMVVIAEDIIKAESIARLSSRDFEACKNISIEEIELTEEKCVLVSNVGA